MERNEQIVVVRGGGDIATGTIAKLHHSGYKVLVLKRSPLPPSGAMWRCRRRFMREPAGWKISSTNW